MNDLPKEPTDISIGLPHPSAGNSQVNGDPVPLDAVISTGELSRRTSRAADYESENRALTALIVELANSPGNVLQKLVDTALDLCRAHSAGVSILEKENGGKIFRWHAVAGRWSGYAGSTMPRESSPCGTVLDCNAMLLMSHPERHFPFPPEVAPAVDEVLLIPFFAAGEAVGTIWVIAHDESRRFDAEDARLIQSLGKFASSTYQALTSFDALKVEAEGRHKAEEALRRSLAKLSDFVETATVGLHWVGAEGTILWANQAEMDLLGYSREEYIGRHMAEFHANPSVIEDILARIDRGETLRNYEARLRCKDGSIRHVLIDSSALFENGKFIHTRCFTRDISERKQAEEALGESERRFREMIDALPAAIYTTDAEGRLTHFNPAAVEFSGRTPELGTDQWCVSWKLYYPDGTPMPHDKCPMALALKEGRTVRGAEAIAERPDGKRIRFTPYPTPIHDADGRIVGGINMLLDITERKEAEEARARLAAIVESADDAIVSKDLNGIIMSWNLGAERLFGYTAAEAIGQPVSMLIPAERLDEEPRILERIRRGERIEHYETVRRRKDGVLLDISLTVSPIVDPHGRVMGASKIARDITERKQVEQKLRENQERLSAELAATQWLQETSTQLIGEDNVEALHKQILSTAVAIMGADFASLQMLYAERGAGGELRLLGHRGFSTEAASFWEWVRPASESTCGLALRTGQRVVVPDVEKCDFMSGSRDLAFYLQTGIHAVQTTPLLSRDGQLVGMISTHWRVPHQPTERDLSLLDVLARQAADLIERSKAAEALRESEQRFRSMADSSPNIIWLTDAAGSLKFINRAYLEFLGIGVEELPSFDWRQIVHVEDRDRYEEAFMAALRERRPFHERVRIRRRDGQWRWLEARGAPIFDHGGHLTGYIGSSPDITDIYESQQALKELSQRKDEFLANMSHEIRSPLTGIMGYADILLDKLKDPDDIECLRTIKESGDYLIEIVNDILDLSKIEAGKLVLNIEDVSVHALLAEIQALMDMRAAQKKLPLSLRYESALPERIRTDRTRLRQILINLVSNAIKFTERGRVEMVVKVSGDLLRIDVVDTGIGIALEHQQILFQPFTQADTTSTREYGGTGLGLTITKRLVEMLGGEISFESELGKGSAFRVAVPIGTVEAIPRKKRNLPEARAAQPGARSLDDRRVLVVDDREEICYLVSRYIREAGGRPETAADGESAIEAVMAAGASDPFDAMILDIHMPGMDGYEVARTLRQRRFRTAIIALTAGAMVGDREKCIRAGCDDYLTKPIDRHKLVELVARHTADARDGARANGGKIKVLLVDDSHNACTLLSGFLEKRGHEVRAAHDGASALALARNFHPEVILLDIRLPDMNGYELMQRLKETERGRTARFIAISGYQDGDAPGQGSLKFDHFLTKPLDLGHVEACLRPTAGEP